MSEQRAGGTWGAVGIAALLLLGLVLVLVGFLTAEFTLGFVGSSARLPGPLPAILFFSGLVVLSTVPFAAAWWSGKRWPLRGAVALLAGVITTRTLYSPLGDLLLSLLREPLVVLVFDLGVVMGVVLAIAIGPWDQKRSPE